MDTEDKVCVRRCRNGHPEDFPMLVDRGPVYNLIDSYLTISSPVSPDGSFLIKGIPPLSGKLSLKFPGALTTGNYVTVIYVTVRNGELSEIEITVPVEQSYQY